MTETRTKGEVTVPLEIMEQLAKPEKIHGLLADAAGRMTGIAKTETNREQGFKFRSIDAITEAAKPIFAELGISVTPNVRSVEHHEVTARSGAKGYRSIVLVEYEFGAPDGSIRRAAMAGEAIDYGDKATSKAVQMAFKYLLTEVLLVGSGGEEADAVGHDLAEAPEPVTAWAWLYRQLQTLTEWSDEQRMEAVGVAGKALAIPDPNVMDRAQADAMLHHINGQYGERER